MMYYYLVRFSYSLNKPCFPSINHHNRSAVVSSYLSMNKDDVERAILSHLKIEADSMDGRKPDDFELHYFQESETMVFDREVIYSFNKPVKSQSSTPVDFFTVTKAVDWLDVKFAEGNIPPVETSIETLLELSARRLEKPEEFKEVDANRLIYFMFTIAKRKGWKLETSFERYLKSQIEMLGGGAAVQRNSFMIYHKGMVQ